MTDGHAESGAIDVPEWVLWRDKCRELAGIVQQVFGLTELQRRQLYTRGPGDAMEYILEQSTPELQRLHYQFTLVGNAEDAASYRRACNATGILEEFKYKKLMEFAPNREESLNYSRIIPREWGVTSTYQIVSPHPSPEVRNRFYLEPSKTISALESLASAATAWNHNVSVFLYDEEGSRHSLRQSGGRTRLPDSTTLSLSINNYYRDSMHFGSSSFYDNNAQAWKENPERAQWMEWLFANRHSAIIALPDGFTAVPPLDKYDFGGTWSGVEAASRLAMSDNIEETLAQIRKEDAEMIAGYNANITRFWRMCGVDPDGDAPAPAGFFEGGMSWALQPVEVDGVILFANTLMVYPPMSEIIFHTEKENEPHARVADALADMLRNTAPALNLYGTHEGDDFHGLEVAIDPRPLSQFIAESAGIPFADVAARGIFQGAYERYPASEEAREALLRHYPEGGFTEPGNRGDVYHTGGVEISGRDNILKLLAFLDRAAQDPSIDPQGARALNPWQAAFIGKAVRLNLGREMLYGLVRDDDFLERSGIEAEFISHSGLSITRLIAACRGESVEMDGGDTKLLGEGGRLR